VTQGHRQHGSIISLFHVHREEAIIACVFRLVRRHAHCFVIGRLELLVTLVSPRQAKTIASEREVYQLQDETLFLTEQQTEGLLLCCVISPVARGEHRGTVGRLSADYCAAETVLLHVVSTEELWDDYQ
jgi:hypothetical protein